MEKRLGEVVFPAPHSFDEIVRISVEDLGVEKFQIESLLVSQGGMPYSVGENRNLLFVSELIANSPNS